MVDFEPPADVLAALAPTNTSIARGQRAWVLLTRYGGRDDRSTPTETLHDDLAFVRELVAQPPEPFGPAVEDVASAVAATALVHEARRTVSLAPDEIGWAAGRLAECSPFALALFGARCSRVILHPATAGRPSLCSSLMI